MLEYAPLVWDPHRQADTLENVCRVARHVKNDYTTHTSGCVTGMIKGLGWESLEDQRFVARHSLLYKIQNGLVDIDAATYLMPCDRHTSKQSDFFQERINNETHFHSSFPRTIREWNALPSNVTSSTTGHFHFKLEKKFSQGVQKKYPYIIFINVFSLCIYPKLHGKYF